MKKILFSVVLVLSMSLLTSCNSKKDNICGMWYIEKSETFTEDGELDYSDFENYFATFLENGTVVFVYDGGALSCGKYKVKGNTIEIYKRLVPDVPHYIEIIQKMTASEMTITSESGRYIYTANRVK